MGVLYETGAEVVNNVNEKGIKFPKAVGFIVSYEFCAMFSIYGIRTILVFYLRDKLHYDNDTATIVYHTWLVITFIFPIIGALIADNWLGKFKAVLVLTIAYVIGNALIAAGAVPAFSWSIGFLTIFGLLLTAFGSGGVMSCISAFGGDQFVLPEQTKQLSIFFSLFYFTLNVGVVLTTFISPILRVDVKCFGEEDCYLVAFSVLCVMKLLGLFLFGCSKKLYKLKKPEANITWKVIKCIGNAISQRGNLKTSAPREHWLDYADEKYGAAFISDIKAALRMLTLFLPLPLFWALFDQQGSRWTFQASRMNGQLGSVVIKPDQMQMVNSFLVLAFIPLFQIVIYPLLAKCKIQRPLQKLTIGGILAGIAFIISGIVELQLEKTYPVLPSAEESQFRFFNGLDCNFKVTTNVPEIQEFDVTSLGYFENKFIAVNNLKASDINIVSSDCSNAAGVGQELVLKDAITLREFHSMSYFLRMRNNSLELEEYMDDVDKSRNGYPKIRVLSSTDELVNIRFVDVYDGKPRFTSNSSSLLMGSVPPSTYKIWVDEKKVGELQILEMGGVFTYIVNRKPDDTYIIKRVTIAPPNSIHMMWLIPQYVVITLGEIMFSVTGLEFSFSQAPQSMKSLMQSFWLLTICFGNIIVVIVAEAKAFDKQSSEFFLFAGLMFVDMAIFMLLTTRYKYVSHSNDVVPKPDDMALKVSTVLSKGEDNPNFKRDE